MSETVELKLDGLEQFLKALKREPPKIKVGILGSNSRSGNGPSNAEIGMAHEFGTSTIPQRSFLRVPLIEQLGKRLAASGAFSKAAMADVLRQGSLVPWAEKVAIEAEGVVLDAFDTNGYGKWVPLALETLARKKVKQTLVETQQLRESITSEVVP